MSNLLNFNSANYKISTKLLSMIVYINKFQKSKFANMNPVAKLNSVYIFAKYFSQCYSSMFI